MNVFTPMDSWIAATGRTDEWLSLGLDLLDRWQATAEEGLGQGHLVAVLAALQVLRSASPATPDPLVVAVWFHHVAEPVVYERIAALGEPVLAGEVARLVRQLGMLHPDPDDPAGALLHAAHLAAVPPVVGDQ